MEDVIDEYICDEFIPDILIGVLTSEEDDNIKVEDQIIWQYYDNISKECIHGNNIITITILIITFISNKLK